MNCNQFSYWSKEQGKNSWYQHFYLTLILEVLDNEIRKDKEASSKMIGMEEQNQSPPASLSADNMTIHAENPRESTEKLLEQIREFS